MEMGADITGDLGQGLQIIDVTCLRGPGNVLGTVQSGLSGLRFPDFLNDLPLLLEARERAGQLLAEDPRLDGIHQKFKTLIQEPEAGISLPGTA